MTETFCVLPWLHLATHPHGGATLCCNAYHPRGVSRSRNWPASGASSESDTTNNTFLDLKHHGIGTVMNSDSFSDVRLRMLAGEKPFACMRCYREESQGIRSKRSRENDEYHHFTVEDAKAMTLENGRLANVDLQFVELRLGNICNAKCRTCNPWSSSKWISDHQALRESHPELPEWNSANDNFDWPESEMFWDDLFERSKNARVFYINGGEPTLIAHHFRFLERMVAAGRTDVRLWYNINMTNMNADIIKLWSRFDSVEIGMSIDDLGDRNAYIRNPTRWDDVMSSLGQLLEHRHSFRLGITQTVSWMNYAYLGEFYLWAESLGLHVHHNMVNDPSHFSPDVLPLEMRLDINRRLGNIMPEAMMNALRQFESKPTDMSLFERAWGITRSLDELRGESFARVFPELYASLTAHGMPL